MIIAVSGSQGSGKTTLLNGLSQRGYSVIERKTSRSILSDWGVTLSEVNNHPNLTVRFQNEILKRKIADEREAAISNDVFLTERSMADLWVYSLVALGKDNEYSSWLDDYYEQCKEAQASYAGIVYLTAGHFHPVDDGVRATNQHYSKMVDLLMTHYINQITPTDTLTIIDTPQLDHRVNVIVSAIQNKYSIMNELQPITKVKGEQ